MGPNPQSETTNLAQVCMYWFDSIVLGSRTEKSTWARVSCPDLHSTVLKCFAVARVELNSCVGFRAG